VRSKFICSVFDKTRLSGRKLLNFATRRKYQISG
jgi:hypothetical protein